MCSIYLDDATAAIVRQNAHHTPVYWWRGDRVMTPISVWGWLGGHDGQRPMGKFGHDARVTRLLFFEGHPGIFNDHSESGPRFSVSSEGRPRGWVKHRLSFIFGWTNPLSSKNDHISTMILCCLEESKSYRSEKTWRWVKNAKMLIKSEL